MALTGSHRRMHSKVVSLAAPSSKGCSRRRRGGTWTVADDGMGARDRARCLDDALRTEFDSRIGETPMNFTGSPKSRLVNGSVPAPTLRWKRATRSPACGEHARRGRPFTGTAFSCPRTWTSPGSQLPRHSARETYVYRRRHGMHKYHSHSGFQEQRGLYGPLVIEPLEPSRLQHDREHVVMLTDWTDENPARVCELKKRSTTTTSISGQSETSPGRSHAGPQAGTRRSQDVGRDADEPDGPRRRVRYTYTYLMNGTAPAGNWTGLFKSGERVRLRFINGSAMSHSTSERA